MPTLYYLASPFTHPDRGMMDARYNNVCAAQAWLIMHGREVFCPIAHSYYVAMMMHESAMTDLALWLKLDLEILRRCDALIVLTLPGWRESKGVAAEIALAKDRGMPITYMDAITFNERSEP